MKTIATIILAVFLSATTMLNAQSVGINADGSTPETSAMLDVKSTDKGFLAPRMTVAQRDAIETPAAGLLVYQTDSTPGYYYYSGSAWLKLDAGLNASQWTSGSGSISYTEGNVGIGTTTPSYKLEVNGNIKASHFGLDVTGYFQKQVIDGSSEDVVIACDNNDFFFYERESDFYQFNIGGAAKLRIQADGKVGIGTMTPDAPLHVNGSVIQNAGARYFNGGTGLITGTTDFNMSIHASNDIVANGSFVAISDKRVKENITELHHSLDMIGKLRPVSYNKIDKVEQGNKINYGFIAQEVETVIPNAVNTSTGEIPVLKPLDKVKLEDGASYTILVKNGDDIKEQKYTTKDPKPKGEIIVKSITVNDFKSITYDMIFTVAVDAIQEQQVQIESQQKQIDELKELIKQLQKK